MIETYFCGPRLKSQSFPEGAEVQEGRKTNCIHEADLPDGMLDCEQPEGGALVFECPVMSMVLLVERNCKWLSGLSKSI